jgi:hypothetical protein
MTPEKVAKLRELAERGVGGEKDNARAILTKNGIDWKKPVEPILTRVKQAFNMNTYHTYKFDFSKSTDLLLLQILCETIAKRNCQLRMDIDLQLQVVLSPGEYAEIYLLYKKNSDNFAQDIFRYARTKTDMDFRRK